MTKSMVLTGASIAAIVTGGWQAPANAQSDDFALEEIVVTARRRVETVQDVPLSVTAISPREIERAFAVDIQDLEGRTPNLIIDSVSAGPRGAAIAIRGISFEDIEKSFDPAVGVMIDGVVIGTNTGQLLNPFDFESVEILRGPQGTLFGRNTTGGVINVRRTRPTGELGLRGQATIGNFGRREYQVVANAPVIEDKLAIKGSFFLQNFDGFYHNATLNQTAGETDFWHASVAALFTPNDRISVLLTYDRMRDRGETINSSLSQTGLDVICAAPGVPGFAAPQECNRNTDEDLYTIFSEREGPIEDDINAITAEINVSLGRFDLTSITGWRDQDEDVQQDFDASSARFFFTRRLQNYSQFTQELRLAGQITDALDGVVGLFYFNSEYDLTQFSEFGNALAFPFQTNEGVSVINATTDHEATAFAAFADAQYQLTDNWRINGGVRWTYEEKELFRDEAFNLDPTFNIVQDGTGPLPAGNRFITFAGGGDEDFDELTWRIATDYKFTADFMGYASIARGFRSGGFNGRANSLSSLGPYQPETVTTYEVGAKTDWLDGRLRINFAAFVSDYQDKQEEVVRPVDEGGNAQETVVENAASANIKGIEIEVTAIPFDGFTLQTSLGLLDADYDEFLRDINGDLVPDDVSTLNLRRTPDTTFSISGNYEYPLGSGTLNTNVSFRYLDSYFTSIVVDPSVVDADGNIVRDPINDLRSQTDSQSLLDASLAYDFEVNGVEIRASVFGRNLLDDVGINSTLPVAGLLTFGVGRAPRQYGGSVEFSF
ncbi:MAG: TonB-dependent receptor [Pseudomonadota bacterium]